MTRSEIRICTNGKQQHPSSPSIKLMELFTGEYVGLVSPKSV